MSEEFVQALVNTFSVPSFVRYEDYVRTKGARTSFGIYIGPQLVKSVFRDYLRYQQRNLCCLCGASMQDERNGGVVHHDHITGVIIGIAHDLCNTKEGSITVKERHE